MAFCMVILRFGWDENDDYDYDDDEYYFYYYIMMGDGLKESNMK